MEFAVLGKRKNSEFDKITHSWKRSELLIGDFIMQLPTGTSFYGTGEIGGASERSGKRVSMVL